MVRAESARKFDGSELALAEQTKNVRLLATRAVATTTATDRLIIARSFGHEMVRAWWQSLTIGDSTSQSLRKPQQEFERGQIADSIRMSAHRIGAAAASFDTETAAHQIGVAYSSMLPAEYRAEFGVYYTPPALTKRLVDLAAEAGVDWAKASILDPACGGGTFLTPLARRIVDALPDCDPRILIENIGNRLHGFEIDPFAAWLSQVALDAVLLPVTDRAGHRLPMMVTVCDSLRSPPPNDRFDFVIGNPPYGRVRLNAADRARFQRSLYGHANLYGLFTDMALSHTRPGGIVAYVTPTSFLAGEYFKNLRELIARNAPPVSLDFVRARKGVFDDVLQETLLVTYRRGAIKGPVKVHEIAPTSDGGLDVTEIGTCELPAEPSHPWLLPRNPVQGPLVASLAKMRHRLSDWGYVVNTGPLVWNRHKNQLAHRPRKDRYPLIWAEAVTSDGRFVFRAEKKNHAPYFEVQTDDDWLVTRSTCVLLQRTTAKEQSRRLVAAALPKSFLRKHGAVVVENHLNMLRPVSSRPLVAPEVLATFLNSAAADRVFRCASGSVAVSAYELEALPLPAPEKMHALATLIRSGASRDRIERACARLYLARTP